MGVSALGAVDLRRAEIDADAVRWGERVEQMAVPAAELQYAFARQYEELHIAPFFLVVVGMTLPPAVALGGELFGLREQKLLAARGRALQASRKTRRRRTRLRRALQPDLLGADLHFRSVK